MDYDKERDEMVTSQLIRRGISDPLVLEAFRRVARHDFVPEAYQTEAYGDYPLPIGCAQTISQPYMVALMTELLHLKGTEKILEIGTGSGYQAAILAQICAKGKVYTIEREEELFKRSGRVLSEKGYINVECILGDGTKGFSKAAPFDGVIVTAGAPYVADVLKKQLANKGRLVIPVGTLYSQMLVVIERNGNDYKKEEVCGCIFVPLIGEHGWGLV